MTGWQLRPARDLDLGPAARLRSNRRETGLLGLAGGVAWRLAARGYLAAAHRLEVVGAEHLPAEPPCVLVSNHTSHLDALCLAAALPGRLARHAVALAAGDVFFGTAASAVFASTALNALPIWRDDTSQDDLALLRARRSEDRMVFILFPEGTRARDGRIGRFRPGLGAFVAGSTVPVAPCHLEGAFDCWPATRRLPRPGKLRLRIGQPLRFDAVANDREGWKQVALEAERAVRALGLEPQA
jgi:1-acyl-sn-glycerol-3-phosphate acyltransferase